MRLGILGGTFDPVHYGHLLLAEVCRENCQLDRVWFLPAADPPHKTPEGITPAPRRVEMLKLAIAGHPDFEVCELEVERGGVNYTFETLSRLRERHPDDEMFFIIGGDSLHDFSEWREPSRICELAQLVVVARPGSPPLDWRCLEGMAPPEKIAEFQRIAVTTPLIDVSSRDLRARVAAGRSIRYRTPRAVEKYIETHGLYRQG